MINRIPGSFRDPSGFLFKRDGVLYRQINNCYREDYQALMNSGLYQKLVDRHYLVPHQEVPLNNIDDNSQAYRIIKPETVQTISYPYEWSFSQLKDAALLTLDIQRLAMNKNMSLKDASAYNIQFHRGKPVFIDTLSFEQFRENEPWVAYRQFCQHFLAPLALMAKTDISLAELLRNHIDGIPLQLASKLLPFHTRLQLSLGLHIHLHARSQKRNAGIAVTGKTAEKKFTHRSFLALIDHLASAIKSLNWTASNTEWFDYYENNNNYQAEALSRKDEIVAQFMEGLSLKTTWDLGANTGRFSKIASTCSETVCAWDIDPACVELHYLYCKQQQIHNILPLLMDLTNPSPAIGWHNSERMSLVERGPVDMVLALGLVHHLAIANNVPIDRIACFLRDLTHYLIIEFIPKEDSQVVKLLQNRKDIFPDYEQASFEQVFSDYFTLIIKKTIPDSKRTLYLFSKSL
ncbi:MAG: SAM-dependent methyltransferase [Gammaproteobacteria bacterium]